MLATISAFVIVAALAWTGVTGRGGPDWPGYDYKNGDFFQFRAGARAILEGASPYDAVWWSAFHVREASRALLLPPLYGNVVWTTPYPLWTFVVLLPFGALPLNDAAAAWLIAQLVGVAAGVVALAYALRLAENRAASAILALLLVSFEPTWALVHGGNVTGFVFTAFATSVACAIAGRYRLAGAAVALVLLKPQSFALAVPLLFLGLPSSARRPFALAAALVAGALLMASLAISPAWLPSWLKNVAALQGSEYSNATGWTLGRPFGAPILSVVAVASVVVAFVWWWRLRRPALEDLIAAATPVSVFISPHGWSSEHLYLLVPTIVLQARMAPWPALSRLAGLTALILVLACLPWALQASRRNGEELSALVPLACFALVVVTEAVAGRRAASSAASPA